MNVERQAGLEWWQLLELRLIRASVANRKIIMILIHLSAVEFDAFELWCWRRLLRVPWTARRSNQSILKEINPEYSLEGLMLKLQYFGHLMKTADSLEKTLMLGKIEGKRRGWQRMRWLDVITNSMDMNLGKLQEMVREGKAGMLQSMGSQRVGYLVTEQQQQIYTWRNMERN